MNVTAAKYPDHEAAHHHKNLAKPRQPAAGSLHCPVPAQKVAGSRRSKKHPKKHKSPSPATHKDTSSDSGSTDPEVHRVAARKQRLAQARMQKSSSDESIHPPTAINEPSSGEDMDIDNNPAEPLVNVPEMDPNIPIPADLCLDDDPQVPLPRQAYVEDYNSDADEDEDVEDAEPDCANPDSDPQSPGSSSSSDSSSDFDDVEEIANQL